MHNKSLVYTSISEKSSLRNNSLSDLNEHSTQSATLELLVKFHVSINLTLSSENISFWGKSKNISASHMPHLFSLRLYIYKKRCLPISNVVDQIILTATLFVETMLHNAIFLSTTFERFKIGKYATSLFFANVFFTVKSVNK